MRNRLLAGGVRLMAFTLAASIVLLPAAAFGADKPTSIVGNEGAGFGPKAPGDGEEVFRPLLFDRTGYVWPYSTGPTYGLSQLPTGRNADSPGMLHTMVGMFDLTRGLPQFPPQLMTTVKFDSLGAQYFVLQFHPDAKRDGSYQDLRAQIEAAGGEFMQSMRSSAYVVRMTPAAYGAAQGASGVLTLMPYHPAFKLSPLIGRAPLHNPARAISETYRLQVRLFDGEDGQTVAQAIANLGANVVANWGDTLTVEIHRDTIPALVALEPVREVNEDLPIYPMAEETTVTMHARDDGRAVPYFSGGVDGGSQLLMVIDTGISLDANDLSNTAANAGSPGASHRKVEFYGTTNPFGGNGDLLGCDATLQGGFTHGHTVATTALGNATDVDAGSYGPGIQAFDEDLNAWNLDGVAKGARLIMYDAQDTPAQLSCDDPSADGLSVGNLFTAPAAGSLPDGYTKGARIANFSFGSPAAAQTYGGGATDIDNFLTNALYLDAMVFTSAGNQGADSDTNLVPDRGSVADPATCKNCISVGASGNLNALGAGPNSRAFFSSVGPANTSVPLARVAPVLMAPGTDFGNIGNAGLDSEFSCRSQDNDQSNPVQCDIVQGVNGTSFSSPAAAGAGLMVRDYFNAGYYPTGTNRPADAQPTMSGALLKAILIASADFMTGGNLWEGFRVNYEQGFGRIKLDNALPLSTWANSPFGLVVADGGITGGPNNTSLDGTITFGTFVDDTYQFRVEDTTEELRVACAWMDPTGADLQNDIDIELSAPDGTIYIGNFFGEDTYFFLDDLGDNPNDIQDPGEENCINDFDGNGQTDALTEGAWSIPVNNCVNSTGDPDGAIDERRDESNTAEAIMLSPDPQGDSAFCLSEGTCEPGGDDPDTPGEDESDDNQLQSGLWTLTVKEGTGSGTGTQTYACAIAGPVLLGSNVRLNQGAFVCNDSVTVTVNETDPTQDSDSDLANAGTGAAEAAEVASRITVRVFDRDSNLVDEESGSALNFTKPDPNAFRYSASNILLTDGTSRSPGATHNSGVLDVRTTDRIEVVYADETSGAADPNKERTNGADVNCDVAVSFGGVTWGQFGVDTAFLVDGGCERDARGKFTFGFADRYMDEGETLGYRIAFLSAETSVDLVDALVSLECIIPDGDSPEDCKPGSGTCTDPNRLNNLRCDAGCTDNCGTEYMTILDSPRRIGLLPTGVAVSVNFTLQMGNVVNGPVPIEMVARITAKKSGKSGFGTVVVQHDLDADEVSLFYDTDFPTGGVEQVDWNEDEVVNASSCVQGVPCTEANRGTPTDSLDFEDDYRFETRVWSDLTAGATKNTTIQAPWNFDANNGNFRVGLHTSTSQALSDGRTMANWGEDRNFNNSLDPGEDRDPINGLLDNNWGTEGGCGWQTASGPGTGGVWHTGRIDATTVASCALAGGAASQCQLYETAGAATTQARFYMETLKTPIFQKVNGDNFTVQFMDWSWNLSLDLEDDLAFLTWELDTDTTAINPSNLDAFPVLNLGAGPIGAVSGGNAPLWDGYMMFASTHVCDNGDGVTPGTVPCDDDQFCVDEIPGATVCLETAGGLSVNGSLGGNRSGQNSCFFEGVGISQLPFHLAGPPDDDQDNNSAGGIDEYVEENGPRRNMDLSEVNGYDMRFTTLEDVYGESGTSFQGALGFLVIEGTPFVKNPASGFGAAVDDMRVAWREFRLDQDQTDCATSGSCAAIEIENTNVFEGSATINVRIVDASPWDPVSGVNNCNLDRVCGTTTTSCQSNADCVGVGNEVCEQDFSDAGDDTDCDNNGTVDIVASLSTESLDEETLVLNRDPSNANVWEGTLSVSAAYNVPGVLFVRGSGTDNPTVTVRYEDEDDGNGARCANDIDPAKAGFVEANTTIFISRGTVIISGFTLSGGDNDPFADSGETLDLNVDIKNQSGVDLGDIVMRIQSDAPEIDCVITPFVTLASLGTDPTACPGPGCDEATMGPFQFRVADGVNRTDTSQDLSALFVVTMTTNRFDGLLRSQDIAIDLNLNATDNGVATTVVEDFETNTLGNTIFSDQNDMDAGKNSLALSDGYRCQYNDPDFPNSNSYPDSPDCFLGFTVGQNNGFDWHIHRTSAPDGGRAFEGSRSLHWGKHTSDPAEDTVRLKQLEALQTETSELINLGTAGAESPKLRFKHQVSLMDSRGSNTPFGEAVDRAVVQIRPGGTGDWLKISPFQNVYDVQGTDQFSNCTFDPIDDGSDEDDYFDPLDPNRTLGPSTTCFPEFVFGYQGDTDYRNGFSSAATGRASDPESAAAGATGNGTWVETQFDLSRFRGRSFQMRVLTTSIEIGTDVDYLAAGFDPDSSVEDGWYIDLLEVTGAQTIASTLAVDNGSAGSPACSTSACTTVTPSLVADPTGTLGAPGQVVELDAGGSTADSCPDGVLQFQFWDNTNNNTTLSLADGDVLLRDWTDNPIFVDAPGISTNYGVLVRCAGATAPGCDSEFAGNTVNVTCPSAGTAPGPAFSETVRANTKTQFNWTTVQTIDAIQGDLDALRGSGSFANTVNTCLANNLNVNSFNDPNPNPAAGSGYYYLVRGIGSTEFCNAGAGTYDVPGGGTSGKNRDTNINADPDSCP